MTLPEVFLCGLAIGLMLVVCPQEPRPRTALKGHSQGIYASRNPVQGLLCYTEPYNQP
jgi:hypothetical protein